MAAVGALTALLAWSVWVPTSWMGPTCANSAIRFCLAVRTASTQLCASLALPISSSTHPPTPANLALISLAVCYARIKPLVSCASKSITWNPRNAYCAAKPLMVVSVVSLTQYVCSVKVGMYSIQIPTLVWSIPLRPSRKWKDSNSSVITSLHLCSNTFCMLRAPTSIKWTL